MSTKELLIKAADHIEKVGWTKRQYFNYAEAYKINPNCGVPKREEVPCCTLGALRVVSDYYSRETTNADDYHDAHVLLAHELHMPVAMFNDSVYSTKESVVAKLREIAGKL